MQLELPLKVANFFGIPVPAPPPLRSVPPGAGRDEVWTQWCGEAARKLGLPRLAASVEVHWNRRLKTTAGLADVQAWRIELNPRLLEFAPAEPAHTVKHELAHLVAQARAGRRRIASHGAQWRRACADLGIPEERAHHGLPLPRRSQKKQWEYHCRSCGAVYERVRRMRYVAACSDCCRKYSRGRYSERYRLVEQKVAEVT